MSRPGVSSAHPEHLLRYATAARENNGALTAAGARLSFAIQALLGSTSDRRLLSGITDLGASLQVYARRKHEIDEWVRGIGNAFQTADVDGAGGPVTVPDEKLAHAAASDRKVAAALRYFRGHLRDGNAFTGNRAALDTILAKLEHLSRNELNEFLGSLSNQELKRWNKEIRSVSNGFLTQSGLDRPHRVALANLLLLHANAKQLGRLERYLPVLNPEPGDSEISGPFRWLSLAELPLFGPSGKPNIYWDINQGDDGDCYFLAGLGEVARIDPSLIRRHIRENANGTYTVTFYSGGKPVEITITDSVPYNPAPGFDFPYAHTITDEGGWGDDKWVMLYEKAYAQFRGGYGPIEGGFGSISMAALTGHPGTRVSPDSISLSQIDQKLHDGIGVTIGTPSGDRNDLLDHGKIVGSHEYIVESVDVKHGTITLLNPWGQEGGAPHQITVSASDLKKYFDEVSLVRVR